MLSKKILKHSAIYFSKTREIIKQKYPDGIVTIQFFQRQKDSVLCGMNEVLSLLKKCTKFQRYKIRYLPEGSIIQPKEVVLELEGKYEYFGELEGIIDGILARQTSIATNSQKVFKAANGKEVIFMGDRADHYENQKRDGYAVSMGGIKTQVTNAQIALHFGQAVGTMPHALIQMCNGDIVEAAKAYVEAFPQEKLVALVDFNNDVVSDSIKVLEEFGEKLFAVRVDTAKNLSDKFFDKKKAEYGVTPNLIKGLRKALDKNNGKHIKIIVSSGFNDEKIREFESKNTPVDYYGVGGSILKVNLNFTADAVKFNNKEISKTGRKYCENKKLLTL